MVKIINIKNTLKEAGILLIILTLLFCNLSVMAYNEKIEIDKSHMYEMISNNISKTSYTFIGEELFFEEDMEDQNCPPITPPWGQWKNTSMSGSQTWEIDHSDPEDGDYCVTIKRGGYEFDLNEWLITPSIDLSQYSELRLKFHWYASDYAAREIDICDMNVSISIDNEDSWELLWNEDNLDPFWTWEWQECELDISSYAGENDVRIGFQFNSSNESLPDIQEFSIDSVQILGDTVTDLWCDCGENETISWSYNKIEGIQFIGNAGGGTTPYTNWTWYFGDGEKDKIKNPKHSYDKIGSYDITLELRDSAEPPHVAYSYKTVEIFETPPSEIKLKIKTPSLGIKLGIENTGTLNVTQIFWDVRIEWGLLRPYNQFAGSGNVSFLEGGGKTTVRGLPFVPGFGIVKIVVAADPINSYRTDLTRHAIKIGPIII